MAREADEMNGLMEMVRREKLIAIVRGLGRDHMLSLAGALIEGGITMIEVTFNQARPDTWTDTQKAIRLIADQFAGCVAAGAGTVLTIEQANMAKDAGAQYIVAPNVDEAVIREAKRLGMGAFPGALTPTECQAANMAGADAVKLFPAGDLGPGYLKAIRAPLSHIEFLAVGGISEKNAADFLKAGAVGLGVGGSLVNKEWIEAGDFSKITALARAYRKAVD
jgi:2-dehydro-3-deoxyphosphogluconate aldolase/(4S)-4-hydroxy-2-oxoglutarate aldolase